MSWHLITETFPIRLGLGCEVYNEFIKKTINTEAVLCTAWSS